MGRFLEGRNRIWRAPGGFWGVERSVWGEKRPVLTRFFPDLARKWAITAPFLPRKTLVLATMLLSVVDGIGGFSRSLAWDLHAGGGFNAEAQSTQRGNRGTTKQRGLYRRGAETCPERSRTGRRGRRRIGQAAGDLPKRGTPRGRRKQGRLRRGRGGGGGEVTNPP